MTASLETRVARIEAALGIDVGPEDQSPLLAAILDAAATVFDVPAELIRGTARDQLTVRARFAAIWAIRATCPAMSLRQISTAVGRREHNSVLYALRRANEWRREDETYRIATDRVQRIATGGLSQ